jgi:hypothetical protein
MVIGLVAWACGEAAHPCWSLWQRKSIYFIAINKRENEEETGVP